MNVLVLAVEMVAGLSYWKIGYPSNNLQFLVMLVVTQESVSACHTVG